MGTHEYYSRVRVLLTRHFLMGTRGPRVLVEALLAALPNSKNGAATAMLGGAVGQAFYYFFWTLHFLPSFFHFRAIVFIGGNDKLGSGIPWFLRYSLIQVPGWEDITTSNFVDEITMRSIWKWGDRNAIWTPGPPSVSLHQEKVIFRVIGLRAMQFLP